jgi:hypothetical protein
MMAEGAQPYSLASPACRLYDGWSDAILRAVCSSFVSVSTVVVAVWALTVKDKENVSSVIDGFVTTALRQAQGERILS